MTHPTSQPPPFPGLILAGTDTGVGKTTVARALLRLAARGGIRLLPFKPVETGCNDDLPRDALDLIHAASTASVTLGQVCPYSFTAPLAPSVASRLEGRSVDVAALVRAAHELAFGADGVLVEGAGGLLSPWGPALHLGTFAEQLRLPLLVVAPNRLGTINHTALVAAECRRRGLSCLGFILVHVSSEAAPDHATNAEEILRETGLPFLGALPHLTTRDVDTLANQAAATLDVKAIFRGSRLASPPGG